MFDKYYFKVLVDRKPTYEEVELIGIFQRSRVLDASPMIGGHPGGVVAGPVAVIKHNGDFKEVNVTDLKYEAGDTK